MEEEKLERYRQRYETWRHLDKIRYQIIQASIALLGAGRWGSCYQLFGQVAPLLVLSDSWAGSIDVLESALQS